VSEVVQIRDVGPRDGFQNEKLQIPTDVKIDSIDQLIGAGVGSIEITSFVNPARLPQFADADDVARHFAGREDVELWAFAGNVRGLERAADAGLQNVTTAVALSEEINRNNFGKSTAESLAAVSEFVARAQSRGVNLEVTVATAFGDIEGRTVTLHETIDAVKQVAALGVSRIMLGDTVGVATPGRVRETYDALLRDLPEISLGAHFHDTRGMAVANALAAWQAGVGDFDASFGGLGGCPFARGASGNVATEELVYMFEEMGVSTGIDMSTLLALVETMSARLGREPASDVARAMRSAAVAKQ
jgi:hydroxymethylglutaryl-CoA lyase